MQKQIFAIYFPSWHPDAHYAKWYGQGFSEWELLKSTKPLFPGHKQPKEPSWGYLDESDPRVMTRQIDLAADYGLSGFLFDWYWYEGEMFLEKALEKGFLQAENRQRLKFALMWANHDWGRWPAVMNEQKPGMNGSENQSAEKLLRQVHTVADLIRVAEYCCEHYFCQENYWRIDDRPVFSFYHLQTLIARLGSEELAVEGLAAMSETVRKLHGKNLYLLANVGCCEGNDYCCGWHYVEQAKKLGFEAVFAYNIVRTKEYRTLPDARPVYDYSGVIDSQRFCWSKIEEGGLPHFPSVTIGLDVSPRWNRNITLPMDFKKLGYEPIIVGNTPEQVGKIVAEALQREGSTVIINAWNEWSEGMYLLPEKEYGLGYLEAIQRQLQNAAQ